ncbi:uncharacterized protein LOC143213666 [Lasioglossum baleicum]|uniref:uncharacterized protein LOC143213666 n=1 Tax=Lasioglossum baleicum TaxID=434251 RepID=UPI003FCCA413
MLSEQLTELLGLNEGRSQEPSFTLRRARSSSSVFSDAFSDASTIPPTSIEEHRRLAGHGPSIGLPVGLPEPPQWWDNKKQPAKPQRKATKNKRPATPGQNQRKRCGTTSTPYDQLPREAPPPERPQPRTGRTTRFMPTEQPRPQRLPAPKPKQTRAPTSTTSIPYHHLPRRHHRRKDHSQGPEGRPGSCPRSSHVHKGSPHQSQNKPGHQQRRRQYHTTICHGGTTAG